MERKYIESVKLGKYFTPIAASELIRTFDKDGQSLLYEIKRTACIFGALGIRLRLRINFKDGVYWMDCQSSDEDGMTLMEDKGSRYEDAQSLYMAVREFCTDTLSEFDIDYYGKVGDITEE